jgi:alkylhydroperoxidase family enzyme
MARYTAVLDACVLVPITLADTLLRVAEKGLYRPLWSDRILTEAQDAIEEIHPGIDVARCFISMRDAFDDALVTGWDELLSGIHLPDESRIVLRCAALPLAEAVTRLSDREDPVPDEVWEDAARHCSEIELGALVIGIGLVNLWNRVNVSTRQVPGADPG